jgi:hypothetical protein
MKLNQHTAQALSNLRTNNDFIVFLNALGGYSGELMNKLVFSSRENLSTAQGKAQCIAEIVKAIDNAPKTLEAFKARGNDTQI